MLRQLILYWVVGLCQCFNYTMYIRSTDVNISRMMYEPQFGSGWPLIKELLIYTRTLYYVSCVYQNNTEAYTIIENLMKNGGPVFMKYKIGTYNSKIMYAYDWKEEQFFSMKKIVSTILNLWMEIDFNLCNL